MATRVYEPKVEAKGGILLPSAGAVGRRIVSDASGNMEWKDVVASDPNVLMPIMAQQSPAATASGIIATSFKAVFLRAVVPITGKLKDISVYNGVTVNGETRVAIYDTGDAVAGKYTLLKQSAATAMAGVNSWQSLGTLEELSLTAGQHILMAVMNSGTTATYGVVNGALVGAQQLPASYLPAAGGASPKLIAAHTFGSLAFATITEAELESGAVQKAVLSIGRLS